MFQYRQVLARLRAGEIARSGLMGRDKLGALRAVAQAQGWLDPDADVPDDSAIVAAHGAARRARSTVSSVQPHREVVERWFDAGVQGRAIHAALKREHAFGGSYSAVIRMLQQLRGEQPPEVTVRLAGLRAGRGCPGRLRRRPGVMHPEGKPRCTWVFVMTLCHSRHQYVEFVWDQSSATWLGCHRRAFVWFDGVPERGYRGVQASAGTRLLVSHTRRLPKKLKKLLKRRQVVEPMIDHMKTDWLLDRNWLKGALGDAMHAVLCGAGHNLRTVLAHLRVLLFGCIGHLMLAVKLATPVPQMSPAPHSR